MKTIAYCTLCKTYEYIEIFFKFVFYTKGKPSKEQVRFKCTKCGKYQTSSRTLN